MIPVWFFVGIILLIYSLYKKDPVFISGQALGLIVYARNLYLIFAERSAAGNGGDGPSTPK